MKAYLKNYNQTPRKVRLVADLIVGKKAGHACTVLEFTPKKAAYQMKKLLQSAMANAKQKGVPTPESLVIHSILVNKGSVLRRHRYRSRGRVFRIGKEMSNVELILTEKK